MVDVKVYSTPICMYCNMLKDHLKQKGVEFTEIDVAADEEKRDYIVEKSGQMGVPVTEINGEVVIGFNQAKVDELIDAAGGDQEIETGSEDAEA